MKTSNSRIALLTGASISALGLAMPAQAQLVTDPGVAQAETAPNAEETLILCAIDDTATDPVCVFGQTNTGTGTVIAAVVDTATGEISQTLVATGAPPAEGNVNGDIINNDSAEIRARATATADAGGLANAIATIDDAITQSGTGAGAIALDVDNNALLTIIAAANATATDADATADIDQAIIQTGTSTGAGANPVAVTLTNDAEMDVTATATATGTNSADASSSLGVLFGGGVISQTGTGAGTGAVTVTLDNNSDIDITSTATSTVTSTTGVAESDATLFGAIDQNAVSTGGGDASAVLIADGGTVVGAGAIDIAITASASGAAGAANDANDANADASGILGIYQIVETGGGDGDATATVTNADGINFDVTATALNADTATANASLFIPMLQSVTNTGTGDATATYAGAGDLTIDVESDATGDLAIANAGLLGALQIVEAGDGGVVSGDALASYTNNGADIDVNAAATGTTGADANASLTYVLGQSASSEDGDATTTLVNSDDMDVDVVAVGTTTGGIGEAEASISVAVGQLAVAGLDGTAVAQITNGDVIDLLADAQATGVGFVTGEDFYAAEASANVLGFRQTAVAPQDDETVAEGSASTLFTNNGTVNVTADTDAVATANAAEATSEANSYAYAGATGLEQNVTGLASFISTNEVTATARVFNVTADARATGVEYAYTQADALGVDQQLGGLDSIAEFENGGNFSVTATTVATVAATGDGEAYSDAVGYTVEGEAFTLDVANADPRGTLVNPIGNFTVTANATSNGLAEATAVGMEFDAFIGGAEPTDEALLDGTLLNAGNFTVTADADGGPIGDPAAPGSVATATGIYMSSGVNTVELTNVGTLNVDAITDAGGDSTATGIFVVGAGGGIAPGDDDVMTINNSGTIRVRESVNGGTSFTRGMAIDVAGAPNAVVINLLGTGTSSIYGDIDIGEDDTINVDNGRTSFDGVINPECLPPVFDGAASTCGQGDLNITADGELFLRDITTPSYVFVDTFDMVAGSTLVLELPTTTTGGTQPIGSYPQVFADVANIDGNLLIAPATGGLFADSYTYNNVIDAVVLNGTFDTCGFDGTYSDSVLLDVNCTYDTGENVDLTITRTAFGDVPGLTDNGIAVGEGLECIYDVDLTGGAAAMFEDLFTFNAADYALALNQLAGAAYAGYLQSFTSLGVRYNDILDHATSCEVPALAGSVLACRTAPTNVWAQVDFQNRRTDGDENLVGGYDSDRWTAIVGADFAIGNTAIVGASVGRVTNRVDSRQSNSLIKADGYQIGAYGVFDPGAFYVKGMGSYNWYDGDAERDINFVPFGGTVEGTLRGDPDVRMWTLGAHMGARFAMGGDSAVTPFLNIDYTNVKLKGFTEDGLDGPELTLRSRSEDRTTVTGGVKWAANIGGVVPEATLAYRYQFGDRTSQFTAFFLDDGDEDCQFDIRSENEKRGSILGGLSLGGRAGPVDVRVAYQGVFNSQATSHAGNFKIVLPFGGSRPAPAPVAYVPPPPPPAPVEVAPAPVYTPPPPPPPSSGERG